MICGWVCESGISNYIIERVALSFNETHMFSFAKTYLWSAEDLFNIKTKVGLYILHFLNKLLTQKLLLLSWNKQFIRYFTFSWHKSSYVMMCSTFYQLLSCPNCSFYFKRDFCELKICVCVYRSSNKRIMRLLDPFLQ